MKLKTNTRRRRGKPASFLSVLTGGLGKRHRLPAHVTSENDWEVEVPQIQMSRAFAVMLVLFIVGVGGLFAFQMFGKEEKKPAHAAAVQGTTAPAPLEPQPQPAVVMTPPVPAAAAPELAGTADPVPAPVPAPAPAPSEPADQRTYVWKVGDTMPLVAAQFNVTASALRTANPDKPLLPGTEYTIPRSGRIIGAAAAPAPASTGATILDPLADRRIATVSPPKAEVVPEPEDKSDVPPAKKEVERTTAKAVSTHPAAREENSKPAAPTAKVKPATPPAAPKTAGQRTHVVAKGETVFNIARRFGISAEEIGKANGLDSNYRIRPGQQLKLPVRR